MPRKKPTEVVDLRSSVEAFIEELPAKWQDHPLAWALRQLAMDISECAVDKTAGSVRELRMTMAELREQAGPGLEDGVDEVASRRAARRRAAGLPE